VIRINKEQRTATSRCWCVQTFMSRLRGATHFL
jgi:hypothetical protein